MSVDELVDVVDENDRVLSQATRREVRRRNLRHRAVYILVFNQGGQLFVHRRTFTKDIFPGYWDVAVGGVVNAGEDYDTAAARELREELGVQNAHLRRLFPMRYEHSAARVCGMVYSHTSEGGFTLQASEIVSGEWMDLDVLLEGAQGAPFCPDGLEVLRLYLVKLEAARQAQPR
jgi:isopentenyldiphosphate isomerase